MSDLLTPVERSEYDEYKSLNAYFADTSLCNGDWHCKCELSPYWTTESKMIGGCLKYQLMYWYHPDYLGNTEFITDLNGEPYQYFWHSPWGENIVDQYRGHGTYTSFCRFNGKELDPETGNYYYGARYYDSKMSVWLSVDAMAKKFPAWSSYNFCLGNPVMLIDPDGNAPDHYFSKKGRYLGSDGLGTDVRIHHTATTPQELSSSLRTNGIFGMAANSTKVKFLDITSTSLLSEPSSNGEASKIMVLNTESGFAYYKKPSDMVKVSLTNDKFNLKRHSEEVTNRSFLTDIGDKKSNIVFGVLHRHSSDNGVSLKGQVPLGESDQETANMLNIPVFAVDKNKTSYITPSGDVSQTANSNPLLRNALIIFGQNQ